MKIYYAHPMSWYNTDAERLDVAKLSEYGEVINPNGDMFDVVVKYAKATNKPVMDIFARYIRDEADVVAYRPFYDGRLGAGVAREVFEAIIWNKPVWQVFGKRSVSALGFEHGPFVDKNPQLMEGGMYPATLQFADILTVAETKARIERGTL